MNIQDLPELPVDTSDILPIVFADDNPRKIGRDRISFLVWNPANEPPDHRYSEYVVVMNNGDVLIARYYGGNYWSPLSDGDEGFTGKDFICWADLPDAPAFALPEIQRIARQDAVDESLSSSGL